MTTWVATIKEVNNERLLHPSWIGESEHDDDYMRKFLIGFWGLDKPDVEWYELIKKKELNE